jgi:hypothetical protein
MLQGLTHPGPAFQLDPVRGTYTVVPGVHMHSGSPASARALLQRFAGLGSALRGAQEFCCGILAPGASHAAPHGGGSGSSSGLGRPGLAPQEHQQQQQQREGGAAVSLPGEGLGGDLERLRQLPTVAAFAAALDSQLKVHAASDRAISTYLRVSCGPACTHAANPHHSMWLLSNCTAH